MTNEFSFPRRNAVTRRFTLGAPRDIRVSDDGERVTFLRSAGPEDPVNQLWVVDLASMSERVVADPAVLEASGDLPPEELARRERARESGDGIVSYDATADLSTVCFALGGRIGRADLAGGSADLLATQAGGFDPRLSPDGRAIGYVSGSGLRVVDDDGDRWLIGEPGSEPDTVSWGSAEFIAGEEMGRTRGFWWAPDSRRVLVERVDVAPIETWWIAAPVTPSEAPRPIRYPAAGTNNASLGLAIVGLDGSRFDVDWQRCGNQAGWEYLAAVNWSNDGLILTVQSRDQRTLAILDVDPVTGECAERYRVVDEDWVELVPGSPRLHGERLITVEDRGASEAHGGARQLCVDGVALTAADLQVRRVVHVDDDRIVMTASSEPTTVDIVSIDWTGSVLEQTNGEGVHSIVVGASAEVRGLRRMADDRVPFTVRTSRDPSTSLQITDHSERPVAPLNVTFHRCGERELSTALVLPAGHDGESLPVLLDPYGGPHAQRVQQASGLFHTSQWFADQGFAVVITDGRGTPGRGPRFERAVRGDLAGPVLDDQIDALHSLAHAHPFLDLTRVAVRGWSFGGYLAALAVIRRPDVFHAAIAGAPVTDWRLYDTHYTERYLGHPDKEPANYARTDLCAEVPLLAGPPASEQALPPLMLIHGLADDNVVAAHTLQLSRALLEAGQAHTVLPLSGVTHMTPQEAVAENLLLVQRDFLQDALGCH